MSSVEVSTEQVGREPIPVQGPNYSKMPSARSREAPRFRGDQPEELLRFLKELEDCFAEARIVGGQDKKRFAVRYIDARSENEWMAIPSYDDGSWGQFKEDLIESYPEVASVRDGTLHQLTRICKEYRDLTPMDLEQLLALKRAFTAEVKKLMRTAGLLTNRELVDRLDSCLSRDFASAVWHHCTFYNVPAQQDQQRARHPDDPVAWGDFMEVAIEFAKKTSRSAGPALVKTENVLVNRSAPLRQTPLEIKIETAIESLEQSIARHEDKFVIMDKAQRQGQDELKKGLEDVTRAVNSLATVSQNQFRHEARPQGFPPRNQGGFAGCFYCHGTNHMMLDCPVRQMHLDTGITKVVDNQLQMSDGNRIPREPADKSWKEHIDMALAAKKAQMYMGDYEDTAGILDIGNVDMGEYSLYTNKPRDRRDQALMSAQSQLIQTMQTNQALQSALLNTRSSSVPASAPLVPYEQSNYGFPQSPMQQFMAVQPPAPMSAQGNYWPGQYGPQNVGVMNSSPYNQNQLPQVQMHAATPDNMQQRLLALERENQALKQKAEVHQMAHTRSSGPPKEDADF